MKMYVCIKQIPDPNTVVSKLDPNTRRLVRSGVSLVLDPGDESTISAAIKLRDTILIPRWLVPTLSARHAC